MTYHLVENNENLIMILTDTGGHVTWFEGINPKRVN
jgi:hypothetical protein